MAAPIGASADDEDTRFMAPAPGPAAPPPPPPPGPPIDDIDPFGHPDLDDDAFAAQFGPVDDDIDREPTPALLAARAEPLGGGGGGSPSGRRPRSGRSRASEAARSSRAGSRGRRKPKEPSRILIGLGLVAVLLAGFAAAYFLTQRSGSDDADTAADTQAPTDTSVPSETTASSAVDATTETSAPPAGSEAEQPVVVFDEAAIGPIVAGQSYNLSVRGGPAEASYQLLIDGVAAADPAPELAPVVFSEGRHLLEVMITSPAGDAETRPVLVYATPAEAAPPTWRANLKSVDIEGEGWGLAVQAFEEFTDAGHENLQLAPSSFYPNLAQGYWNIFVGGFPDQASAEAYCAQYGLTVPVDCFVVLPELAP